MVSLALDWTFVVVVLWRNYVWQIVGVVVLMIVVGVVMNQTGIPPRISIFSSQ